MRGLGDLSLWGDPMAPGSKSRSLAVSRLAEERFRLLTRASQFTVQKCITTLPQYIPTRPIPRQKVPGDLMTVIWDHNARFTTSFLGESSERGGTYGCLPV